MMDLPPVAYDHPFDGPMVVVERTVKQADVVCRVVEGVARDANIGGQFYGCKFELHGKCYIVVPTDVPPAFKDQIYRHERAHCNGWVHD